MALQGLAMLPSQRWLMNSGKIEAVPMDHRKKIGSVPLKNCDLALISADRAFM
jgi:hypothetical protein